MTNRVAIAEIVRALAVLALAFLNFAHVPAAAASPNGAWAAVDQSYCGEPLDDGKTQHAPCHACRIGGGADLPPPCPDIQRGLSEAALNDDVITSPAPRLRELGRIFARGPPIA